MTTKCEIMGLSKYFGSKLVVDDVSLAVSEGEFVVLLGPSGCGKTTTLRLIAGLEVPSSGTISIDGRVVSDPAQKLFVRPEHRGIGMVFQSYAVWPHMSVFENVAYPLRVRRWRGARLRAKVQEVLDLVGLGSESARPATALSGGQMQRVALARALVFDPALLLFDEPLSNLDLKLRERLRVELKALQRRTGITSIYVTHDQGEAVELGDRIVVMEGGRMVQIATPPELYQRPQTRFVAEFISTANICSGTIQKLVTSDTALVRTEHGREINCSIDLPMSAGDEVDLVIHPEDCRLARDGGTTEGSFPVRVLQQRYQGVLCRYTVDWNGAPFDVVALGTSAEVPEGAEARLWVDRTRLIPLART